MSDLASIPALAADRILERGWMHGGWTGSDGSECLHQAVRMCAPQAGDGYIVSAWLAANGYSPGWNDARDRTRDDVLYLLKGLDLRDEDLEATFGTGWREWVALVRLVAGMTLGQARTLAAALAAARAAARDAARAAALAAAWDAARGAAVAAARGAAVAAAVAAAWATIAKPHIGDRFTHEQYDLLMRPVVEVFGPDWATAAD